MNNYTSAKPAQVIEMQTVVPNKNTDTEKDQAKKVEEEQETVDGDLGPKARRTFEINQIFQKE